MGSNILLIFLFLGFACSNEECRVFSEAIQKSEDYVETFMQENKVPGMSVAVSYKGQLVWSQGFGYADLENSLKVNNKTKFRIASVSKPVTAVLVARLYQSRVLDIDVPIHDYLTEYPQKRWEFTIRHLMTHSAGVRHYSALDTNFKAYHNSIQNGLEIFKHDSLLFKPGSRFHYSSYGYNIIGAAIEEAIDNSFEKLLTDSLFILTGMNNSTIDDPYKIITNRSKTYFLNEVNDIINAPFFDNRYKIPSGGILSTAEDLVQLANTVMYGEYLNLQSVELLFTPYEYTHEKDSDTGFGWVVTKDDNDNILYGHLGGNTGGCSAILIYPEKQFIIVWLGNLDANWSEKPITSIANCFLEAIEDMDQ